MMLRRPKPSDEEEIKRIHNEFFGGNEYPEFFNSHGHFHCPFVVTDDTDKIIVAGGMQTIAEAVFLTDRNVPARIRLDALIQGLGSLITIANQMRYGQIHAFVSNDDSYVKVLQKYGFRLIDAKLLVLDLEK